MTATEQGQAALQETPSGESDARERAIIHDIGKCGHYLHQVWGGRGGQEPMLAYIYQCGGEIGQSMLLEHFPIASASLSEVLAKLERMGFITRERDEADRRRFTVRLTDAGSERAQTYLAQIDAFRKRAFAGLDDEELDELERLLDHVVRQWEEAPCPTSR
jgi:DNA-binding MarR family transcriptional regulator